MPDSFLARPFARRIGEGAISFNSTPEKLANDLAWGGNDRRCQVERIQDQGQKFVVHPSQMGVARQQKCALQKSCFGQHP
jgi:hypothetical protein